MHRLLRLDLVMAERRAPEITADAHCTSLARSALYSSGTGRVHRKPGRAVERLLYRGGRSTRLNAITITEFRQFRVGRPRVGVPLCCDP